MLHFLVLLAVSDAFVVEPWAGNQRCNDPKFWCQNMDNAKECGVVEYCNIEWGKAQIGINPTEAKVSKSTKGTQPDAAPVKVTLYYESLCPDCKQFIQSQLWPTYQKLSSTGILDLEMVPYGNAREYQYGSKWVFYCQHGAAECTGNLIETCAIHYTINSTIYMPFIYCLEYYGPNPTNAKYCASVHGIEYNQIENCVNGAEGNILEHQPRSCHFDQSEARAYLMMAIKTDALNPPHQYVPWITVNGVHTNQIQTAVQTNMLKYVCETYEGTKPAVCNQAERKRSNVCYKD